MSGQAETGWVIVLYDDVGVLSYWTGQEAWAFSIRNEEAVRFARQQDANTVLDCIVKESDGALLHLDQYPNDKLRVEDHMWCGGP